MCHIAALAALTIAQTVVAHRESAKYADAQNKAVLADYANQTATMNERATQIHAQSADEISERARAAKIEQGRLKALAAESGLGYGVTADRIMNESEFNEGQDIASIQTNYSRALKQNARETAGVYAKAQGDIATIKRPSRVMSGLKIAGAGLDAYNDYKNPNPTRPTKTRVSPD